jgi:hypothetical protein
LQKALNIFNAALVTPTYYVYFTSTTIISSAILFRGFKGTPTSIITVVMGFLTICSGVVLLQLSKSAKDVPDAAVFSGDLDQIQTIAEQPQPETEPKADAIRGTAAIVRRLSAARQKMEIEELKRLHEEKLQESLEPVGENAVPQFEWDGIRRRRTGTFSTHGARSMTSTTPSNAFHPPRTPTAHPPLGWSHIPTEEELAAANRPVSPALSSLVGTIRNRARSVLLPGHPDFRGNPNQPKVQSPMHPVQLTSIAVPGSKFAEEYDPGREFDSHNWDNAENSNRRIQFAGEVRKVSDDSEPRNTLAPPTPPPHSVLRQFSFQNIFKRHQSHADDRDHALDSRPKLSSRGSSRGYSSPQLKGATEEEMLGLVKGDSNHAQSMPTLPRFEDSGEEEDDAQDVDDKQLQYGHSITKGYRHSPPRRNESSEKELEEEDELTAYRQHQKRFKERRRSGSSDGDDRPPPPPPHGKGGAFI